MSLTPDTTAGQRDTNLLDVAGLGIAFSGGDRLIRVVQGLNFHVRHGEVFGLVGESGCGKSLTALSILRILPPHASAEGRVFFAGKELLSLPEEEMRKIRGREIAMVFQEPMTSLNPVLTAGYQVAEVLKTHLSLSSKDAADRAVELFRDVRIPSPELRVKDYPHQLSGGMRQRVMIAMAIACNPSLLIADEPTTALDVTIQAQILDLLQGLRQTLDMSMLLITHDLSIIAEQADRVAIMYAGRIMEMAGVAELFSHTLHPYTRGLLSSLASIRGRPLRPIPGTVPPPDRLPQGCAFSDRCEKAAAQCRQEEPPLTEISPGHFVRCVFVTRAA